PDMAQIEQAGVLAHPQGNFARRSGGQAGHDDIKHEGLCAAQLRDVPGIFPRDEGDQVILQQPLSAPARADECPLKVGFHTSCTVTLGSSASKSGWRSSCVPSVITLAAPAATPQR